MLVVEDNDVLCRVVAREITTWSAEVCAAGSLKAALPLVVAPLDLIVSDVRLPDGVSHGLFERAAQLEPAPLMVAMSGRASPGEAFDLARIGVDAFIAKPFKLPDLVKAVACGLEHKEGAPPENARGAIEAQLRRFSAAHGLSDQQTELIRLLLLGVARKELPAALGVSENTCKTMIRRLLARCRAARLGDVVREVMARSAAAPVRRARAHSRELV